jgi:hypothetical protein
MIDVFNCLVESQKTYFQFQVNLISTFDEIANQTDADIVIIGGWVSRLLNISVSIMPSRRDDE